MVLSPRLRCHMIIIRLEFVDKGRRKRGEQRGKRRGKRRGGGGEGKGGVRPER